MLDVLARSDQRAKGELYVRGLLTDGQRKSMQPMAQRLGVDHQGLQQFVTSSTWDHTLVRRNVARWAADTIRPQAYVVDDTGFAKDGTASPCVSRQYSGTLGKIGNCQGAMSVQLVTDHASLAANWRLFCPAGWDDTLAKDPGTAPAPPRRYAGAGNGPRSRTRCGTGRSGGSHWTCSTRWPAVVSRPGGHCRNSRWPATPATVTPPSSAWA